jgi:hypothetical protein
MMKSVRWPLRGARLSFAPLLLLAASPLGCGLQEHPRASTGGLATGGAKGSTDPGPPPPAREDAAVVEPPPERPPPDGAVAGAETAPTVRPDAAAPPPVAGPGVMINGTMVPREKVIVILHLGHSDMAGRALGPPELKPDFYDTNPHLWQYQKGGVWKLAKEPLSPDGGTPGHPQGAGPGMALLHRALVAAPDAYIVSIGRGQSLDFEAGCFTFRKGGIYHDSILAPALELKGKVTFGGLFTMLGYDGRTDPRAKNGGYIACLQGLADDFRAELGEPDLPFVPGDYERGATGTWAPGCCGAPQVITQLAMVPMRVPHSFLIPTDGLPMQDDHHFNMKGHEMWADRAFMGMAAADLLPWATVK